MKFDEEIEITRELIDKELHKIFENKTGYQEKIFDSIKYSLFTGGKRIRPILMLKTCEMFSNSYENCIPFSLAIEMIHTYSLIHDDLPAMDNDDFRRGKLTNHKIYGEALAILSGDGLLNLAFEIMLDSSLNSCKTVEEHKRNTWAMYEIAKYSGIFGMIGGQVVDLMSNEIKMNEDKLLYMYKSKTAALIQASVVTGAIMADCSNDYVENMRNFGYYLGLAYQIRDDILDETADNDINKITYLTFKDREQAKKDLEDFSEKAINILKNYDDKDTGFLIQLTNKLIDRKS